MELYIGGISQGKLTYVCNKKNISKDSDLICDGAGCTMEELLSKPFVNHFHLFIGRLLKEGGAIVTDGAIAPDGPKTDSDRHFLLKPGHAPDPEKIANVLAKDLIAENPSVVIICNEVGCGIVPVDRTDRLYRETVGRCLCRLAEYSQVVERIVCGLGMRLK